MIFSVPIIPQSDAAWEIITAIVVYLLIACFCVYQISSISQNEWRILVPSIGERRHVELDFKAIHLDYLLKDTMVVSM